MTEIDGRTAVVTGGGSGIGRGLALELAANGAAVVVADIIADNARKTAAEIEAAGGRAIAVHCDVCDRDSVGRLKTEAITSLGPVSLLFANAGATSFEPLEAMSEDDVDWIIQVNLMGVMNCVRAFYPDMVAARDGHLVATASTAGLLPAFVPYHAPYSAAKLGVIGLMLNLRIEAAESGVGCTVLCPGRVESGMKDNNARYRPERFGGPGEGGVRIPEGFFQKADLKVRPASEVARLCLQAVCNNRPMVITDSALRKTFEETYLEVVRSAFDEVEAFDRTGAGE
jgi:NAD(P)-dependent dehydrogenase (short-subunit alcohol dehydrogenase family)